MKKANWSDRVRLGVLRWKGDGPKIQTVTHCRSVALAWKASAQVSFESFREYLVRIRPD